MNAAEVTLPYGANWYDALVVAALVYGVWSGVRTGLLGEIIRVAGLVLMVALALQFYNTLGQWLRARSNLAVELANLISFVGIAVVVYLLALLARRAAHRRMMKLRFTATVENVGGALAGVARMVVIMVWVSVALCLTRSQFWHQQVGKDSKFGSYVVGQLPAVAAVVEKHFPEKMWLMDDLKRRPEPGADDSEPAKR